MGSYSTPSEGVGGDDKGKTALQRPWRYRGNSTPSEGVFSLYADLAQSFFSPDSLRFLIHNVSSFIAFSSYFPKVCSFPRFYLTLLRWNFCKCAPRAM